ncbi:MAG: hypothetical protein ACRERV_01600 [Methylococcales bacterium]
MYRLWPLVPLFTMACLGLIFMVWRKAPYLEYLNSSWLLFAGFVCIGLSALIAWLGRKYFQLGYDLFCLGSLCIWFVHWRAVYRIDAPVFAWYPIFFVLLIVVLSRQVIQQCHRLDRMQLRMLDLIQSWKTFHPALLIPSLLLSIYFSEYYIFYPIVLSFVLIRCCFAIVLMQLAKS